MRVILLSLIEKVYHYQSTVDHDPVYFEILDTAGQEEERLKLEENIRWADAFILMYSITDRVSFTECSRLRFLISYAKRLRKTSHGALAQSQELPIALVGNKCDLEFDRMVETEEGAKLAEELGCTNFYEISVRESSADVREIFEDKYRTWRHLKKSPKSSRKIESPPLQPRLRERSQTISTADDIRFDPNFRRNGTVSAHGMSRNPSISKRLYRVFKKDSLGKDSPLETISSTS